MDTKIDIRELITHFNLNEENIDHTMKEVFTALGDSFSARELCEEIIRNFLMHENIVIDNHHHKYDDYCAGSNLFAVACLTLDKLTHMKAYAKTRGGIVGLSMSPTDDQLLSVITLKQVIKWMIHH